MPVVERKVRLVKERCRSILVGLPYRLPFKLLAYLVMFVVFCLNCVPVQAAGHVISPKEWLTGRKLSYKRDLRFEFGEYIQARTPRVVSNSMHPRTEGDIAVLSTGNVEGSIWCYNLATDRVVQRDRWTVLPIPDVVIQHMNRLSDGDKRENRVHLDPDLQGEGIPGPEPPVQRVAIPDLGGAPQRNTQLPGATEADDVPAEDQLAIRIPKDVWEQGRRALELDLQDGIVRDEDGDIIMEDAEGMLPVEGTADALFTQRKLVSMALTNRGRHVRDQSSKAFKVSIQQSKKIYGEDITNNVLRAELTQLVQKQVCKGVYWDYLTEEERSSTIRCSVFLKEKFKPDGSFDKLKARLVAGGNMQDRTIYSDEETSSPTVSTSALFIITAIAAKEQRKVATMDFSSAYLNADMKKKVLMKFDPAVSTLMAELDPKLKGCINVSNGILVVQLQKALYGCVESAKLWYELICGKLLELGYSQNEYEACIFNKYLGQVQVTVCLYVDDIMMTCCNESILNGEILLVDSLFEGTTVHRGQVHSYIGMTFDFSAEGVVSVRMEGYVDDIIKEFKVIGSAPSPAGTDLFDIDDTSPVLDKDKIDLFHTRTAKLLYMAKRARPDILTAVSFLCTRVQQPTEQDITKLDRVLRYVNSTRDIWLSLSASSNLDIEAYIDASYGVHPDGKGHTGACMTLGTGFFHVQSSKQKLVAKSSTEAELIGVSDGLSMVLWARNFLLAQGVPVGPALVWQDNKSTISLADKGRSTSSRTKHIHIRYFFIKDKIKSGEVVLRYKPTEKMVADILTKPLQGSLFKNLRERLLALHIE